MSEQPGRYQRSPAGMVGALVVTVLVILGFVVFRSCVRTDLDVKPAHVDYRAEVRFAQQNGRGWSTRRRCRPGGTPRTSTTRPASPPSC